MLDFLQRNIANHGARDAANAVTQGNQQGIGAIQGFYDQSRGDLSPYMDYGAGMGGLAGLARLNGGDLSGFWNSPDNVAQRDAMNYGMDHSAAANYRIGSGGYSADLSKAQGDLAAQQLGNYRGSLQWGAGLGQQSAMGLGALGAQAGNNISQLYHDSGLARAGAASAYANNNNNMWGNIANSFGTIFGLGG